jgi:Xaa-Pro aminopeptidase
MFDPSLECAFVFRRDGNVRLFSNEAWDLDRAAHTSWIPREAMEALADLPVELAHHLQENGSADRRIGVVGLERLPLEFFRSLSASLPDAEFEPATNLLTEERILKSPAEVEALRRAVEITHTAIAEGRSALREGISELEVLGICARSMYENGGEEFAFTPEVSFGAMTEVCASPATANRLCDGDMALFDLGCLCDHYVGDLSRTYIQGAASQERRAIRDAVLRAQHAAIEAVRPGAIATELDGVAREVLERAGLGGFFNHGLGHGLGLDHHEPPFIEQDDPTVLKPGMVFTIEPGAYVPGVGGARIEDVVLVTDSGCEVLSQREE